MYTKDIILEIQSLALSERIRVLEEILRSVKSDINTSNFKSNKNAYREEIQNRRRSYKVKAFDLGEDVVVDRDEIYGNRGI